jgi:hypothetical protein
MATKGGTEDDFAQAHTKFDLGDDPSLAGNYLAGDF